MYLIGFKKINLIYIYIFLNCMVSFLKLQLSHLL